MKIVIAGGGRVGSALAKRLVAEHHSVTVIDQQRTVCDRVFEDIGAVAVCGEATQPAVLESAGLGSAEILACVLARDADNLALAMLARSSSNARVMVRMLDNSYADAYRIAGVRDVIPEADVVVGKMTIAIDHPEVLGSLPIAGDAVLFEMEIGTRSLVAGRTVQEVRADPQFPPDTVFIGLLDEQGKIELPKGASELRAGRLAIMVARREQLKLAIAALTPGADDSGLTSSLLPALRNVDFLAPLTDEELANLARGIGLVRRNAGDFVFKKGDRGDAFYIVLRGEVALYGPGGQLIEKRSRGEFFGEMALLTGDPRSADARAVSECELAAIEQTDFRNVVMANPSLALEMSRILGQRLASAVKATPVKRGLFRR